MIKQKWQEEFETLAISITDDSDGDFRRCLIEEGLESEARAKELTKFIKDNNIDCRGCWDLKHRERYLDYLKLGEKITEHWEKVEDEIHYL